MPNVLSSTESLARQNRETLEKAYEQYLCDLVAYAIKYPKQMITHDNHVAVNQVLQEGIATLAYDDPRTKGPASIGDRALHIINYGFTRFPKRGQMYKATNKLYNTLASLASKNVELYQIESVEKEGITRQRYNVPTTTEIETKIGKDAEVQQNLQAAIIEDPDIVKKFTNWMQWLIAQADKKLMSLDVDKPLGKVAKKLGKLSDEVVMRAQPGFTKMQKLTEEAIKLASKPIEAAAKKSGIRPITKLFRAEDVKTEEKPTPQGAEGEVTKPQKRPTPKLKKDD